MPAVRARRRVGNGTRTARKPGANRPSRYSKRKPSGVRKALLGAFLLGAVYGVFQTEHTWYGYGILTNIGLVTGYGLGVTLLVAIVWSLTVVRRRAAALIWRKRA